MKLLLLIFAVLMLSPIIISILLFIVQFVAMLTEDIKNNLDK